MREVLPKLHLLMTWRESTPKQSGPGVGSIGVGVGEADALPNAFWICVRFLV